MQKFIYILLLTIFSEYSFSYEYIFCNSCTQKIEFISFAKGRFGTSSFPKNYQVINYNTEEIWNVYVEREFEPDPNYNFINAIASAPTVKEIADFIEVKEIITQKDFLVILPSSAGDTYDGTTDVIVHGVIAQNPTMITLVGVKWAIKQALGRHVFAIVVFPNGDVAKYKIINPAGGSLCCDYVSGTARDINGDIITDSGGNGGSGGSGDYVQPSGGGITITISGPSSPRFFCWKIPGGVKCRRL